MANKAMTITLRPYLPVDGPRCAAIFRTAVVEIGSDYYSDAQCDAWSSRAEDEAVFSAALADLLTLVAMRDGQSARDEAVLNVDHDEHTAGIGIDLAESRRGSARNTKDRGSG